jgi:hypothetical protein
MADADDVIRVTDLGLRESRNPAESGVLEHIVAARPG